MDSQVRDADGDDPVYSPLFGDLPLVELNLWDDNRNHTETEKSQIAFQELLKRAWKAQFDQGDVDTLNDRVGRMDLARFAGAGLLSEIIITQRIDLRHRTNRISANLFVAAREQHITLFPDQIHGNQKDGEEIVARHDILAKQEGNGTGPGLLFYSHGMPAAVLINQCTMHKIVNGTRAKMYGVVAHPQAKFTKLDGRTSLCSKPALCVLLQTPMPLDIQYEGLPPDVFPVFPTQSTLTFDDNIKIQRKQIPLTPAFAMTEYKVQGASFKTAVLDLHWPDGTERGDEADWRHKRFFSVYVQLSRLETLDGVHLLQPIQFADIDNKPHPDPALVRFSARLDELSEQTLKQWTAEFNARRAQKDKSRRSETLRTCEKSVNIDPNFSKSAPDQ